MNAFPSNIVNKYSSELKLFLDYLYFRFTISKSVTTPGNLLQNLDFKFTHSSQKLNLLIFTVFLPYISDKLLEFMSRNNWSDPNNIKQ
jgi:hypothetical protein